MDKKFFQTQDDGKHALETLICISVMVILTALLIGDCYYKSRILQEKRGGIHEKNRNDNGSGIWRPNRCM